MRTYTVPATNWSTASENKIHDDDVARRYGFGGGLVPGVTLWGYLTRPIVETWGRDWLERGMAEVRFVSPAYDGEQVTSLIDDGRLELTRPDGTVCVTGTAGLSSTGVTIPDVDVAPVPSARPPADAHSLAPGTDLGSITRHFGADEASEYLDRIGDDLDLYRGPDAVAHPGWLLLDANQVLISNVVLGPWVHVGSRIHNLRPVLLGQQVAARARVTDNTERKGHHFVELDVVIFADDEPAMVVHHNAIWKLRDPAS